MGFPVPFAEWMRGKWSTVASEVLLDPRTRQRGLIQPAAVSRLIDAHREGRRAGGDAIWALLNLELWFRTFIDGAGVQTLPAVAREADRLTPVPALESAVGASGPVDVGAGVSRSA